MEIETVLLADKDGTREGDTDAARLTMVGESGVCGRVITGRLVSNDTVTGEGKVNKVGVSATVIVSCDICDACTSWMRV